MSFLNQRVCNLYNDTAISMSKNLFYIDNEEDLLEFWAYYLNSTQRSDTILKRLEAPISTLFRAVARLLLNTKTDHITILTEQSGDDLYFTLCAEGVVEAFRKAYSDSLDFRIQNTMLTIHVPLLEAPKPSSKKTHDSIQPLISETKTSINVFDFIDSDTLEELHDIGERLEELSEALKRMGFNDEIAEQLRTNLFIFSSNIAYVPEISRVSEITAELAILISLNKVRLGELSAMVAPLVGGFIGDLNKWKELLFVTGCERSDIMDDSMASNLEMIKTYLETQANEQELIDDLNDIFDF